jgi:acetolactate decarboxylase
MNKKNLMLRRLLLIIFVLTLSLCGGCLGANKYKREVYQYSTINAFMSGFYDGDIAIAELKKHGDFGIGTFNGIDGELILLGNSCYQAKIDGSISLMNKKEFVPFAVVKYFKPALEASFKDSLSYKELLTYTDKLMPAGNVFLAIKVTGFFSYVKVRSIRKQDKPYKPFSEVAKTQKISEFRNIKGILIGFRFPAYMKELNVPGYHFHFISDDKRFGGHLLDCNLEDGVVSFDISDNFWMQLPSDEDFIKLDLTQDRQKELAKAEK